MKDSWERVRRVMSGEKPDRAPLFDLVANDAVLQQFNGGKPVPVGDDRAGARAVAAAIDGSRVCQLSPGPEETGVTEQGRKFDRHRWTTWVEHRKFASVEDYRQTKLREIREREATFVRPYDTSRDPIYVSECERLSWFGGDLYYLLMSLHQSLMRVWTEVGLEPFSYYLYDCEDVVLAALESNAECACRWIEGLPADTPFETVFVGDDIAFKTGPIVRVDWLKKHYFPRLSRVCAALHAKGKKVLFHSDGNLNPIMDHLVEAGIDALNPIEVCAGMDLAELHRRYPRLVFAGGIDVSHLLPFGTPKQVGDAVVKAIEDTEGRILVGSSTEVLDVVPLANFMAMRDTAMSYRY